MTLWDRGLGVEVVCCPGASYYVSFKALILLPLPSMYLSHITSEDTALLAAAEAYRLSPDSIPRDASPKDGISV
jgi:hypothetical protein